MVNCGTDLHILYYFMWKLCTRTRVIVFFRHQRGTVKVYMNIPYDTNHTSALVNEASLLYYQCGYSDYAVALVKL